MSSSSPDAAALDSVAIVGKAIFGKSNRLRLGIWIAGLRGHPRTFTQSEYEEWCREKKLERWWGSISGDMARFCELGMAHERHDVEIPRRIKMWTRDESPLWDIFLMTAIAMGEHHEIIVEERRHQLKELLEIRKQFIFD